MEDKKEPTEPVAADAQSPNTPVVPKAQPSSIETKGDSHDDSKNEAKNHGDGDTHATLTIIPVRGAVLFPHNVLPLTAGKEWSGEAIEKAIRKGVNLGIVARRRPGAVGSSHVVGTEPPEGAGIDSADSADSAGSELLEGEGNGNPLPDNAGDELLDGADLHDIGTQAKILKIIRFPDNTVGAVVQGQKRFRVLEYLPQDGPNLVARVEFLPEEQGSAHASLEVMALGKGLKQLVQKAVSLSPNIPAEAALFIENVQEATYLADLVVPYLSIDFEAKQELLEIEVVEEHLRRVHYLLVREIEILEMSQKIHSEVRSEVGKQQRKYYVKEQLRMLQKELGELEGRVHSGTGKGGQEAPDDLSARIESSQMPLEAREAGLREVERLAMMQPGSPEYMVSHTYVNWLLDIPWNVFSHESVDLPKARSVLDSDHFGLEKVKKRILEFLAVYALKKSLKGPILVLVGPPGVGKTSLGKSVARALGRKFVRIALGGVRDEAEIRGHRRTYIGSMPGKFADALKKAGSMDPVILLDEIDKLSSDHRGDPSSALLEVLDSEQNQAFVDHYLNVSLDLSRVLFIATANSLHSIPSPLLDRMEVLELSGYTIDEKSHIAFEHLLPQVIVEHGLEDLVDLRLSPEVMKSLIRGYTREAGVRQLRRELSGVARAVAHKRVEEGIQPGKKEHKVTLEELTEALGNMPFRESKRPAILPVGVATGLAYTPVGGDVLFIETAVSRPGTGRLSVTGQLGDVMKESVQTALAYLRANPKSCGVQAKDLGKVDLHVHFPAGAVKKDGPSAGVAVFLAMAAQFSGRRLASDFAVTGEISLRGDVLPVGGIKEKLIAAHRHGVRLVLIPHDNAHDLAEIPVDVKKDMRIVPVASMDAALKIAFAKPTAPVKVKAKAMAKPKAKIKAKIKAKVKAKVKALPKPKSPASSLPRKSKRP